MFWVWSIIKCGLENQWTFDDFPSAKALFIGDVHGCSLVMFDYRRVAQYHPERKFCPMSSAFGLKMSAENRENRKIIEDPHGISHHFPLFSLKNTLPFNGRFRKKTHWVQTIPKGSSPDYVRVLTLHVSSLRMKTRNITKHTNYGIDGWFSLDFPGCYGILSGWWFQTWLDDIPYMGSLILPIDELHHFSRWLKPPTRFDLM